MFTAISVTSQCAGATSVRLTANCPPFFEMTEQPTRELDFIHQPASDADQALLLDVNVDLARHFVKDFSLTRRRPKSRIGLED